MKPKEITVQDAQSIWPIITVDQAVERSIGYNWAVHDMEAHRKEKKKHAYDVVGSIQNLDERLHKLEKTAIKEDESVEFTIEKSVTNGTIGKIYKR